MRLRPLYRLSFDYPESWDVPMSGELGTEEQHFLFAEGWAKGEVTGRFRGSNFPRRRTDKTFLTDMNGVITTDEGATILLECRGFGRPRTPQYDELSPGGRQVVVVLTHVSSDERYRWLNDTVCVGCGQVRPKPVENPTNPTDLVVDVSSLVWEPLAP